LSNSRKPENIIEYKKWLKEKHNILIDKRLSTHYETVTTLVKNDLGSSDFWLQLINNLKESHDEYLIKSNGYLLFLESAESINILIKPFDSLLDKSFRKNILNNKDFDNPPSSGWIFPTNWLTRINDIIRTTIVVKYLDGVEFTLEKLKSFLEQNCNKKCKIDLEAREEGYYAAHINFKHMFEVLSIDFDTEFVEMSIEIQITTQLQELIKRFLHKYYEKKRLRKKTNEKTKWQWNYRSNEFATNYMGHILHYIEGMIMDIRERIKEEEI